MRSVQRKWLRNAPREWRRNGPFESETSRTLPSNICRRTERRSFLCISWLLSQIHSKGFVLALHAIDNLFLSQQTLSRKIIFGVLFLWSCHFDGLHLRQFLSWWWERTLKSFRENDSSSGQVSATPPAPGIAQVFMVTIVDIPAVSANCWCVTVQAKVEGSKVRTSTVVCFQFSGAVNFLTYFWKVFEWEFNMW